MRTAPTPFAPAPRPWGARRLGAGQPPAVNPSAPAPLTEVQFTAVESPALPARRIRATVAAGVVVPGGWEIRLYAGSVADQTNPAEFAAGAILTPGVPFDTGGQFPVGATRYARAAWREIATGQIVNFGDVDAVTISALPPAPPAPEAQADPDPGEARIRLASAPSQGASIWPVTVEYRIGVGAWTVLPTAVGAWHTIAGAAGSTEQVRFRSVSAIGAGPESAAVAVTFGAAASTIFSAATLEIGVAA